MTLAAPWGKLDRQTLARHHLAHHCADVAAVFLALTDLPVLRARMELAVCRKLSEMEIERLAVLVFLHDIGKLFPGFQAKGWPDGLWSDPPTGHVREAIDVLCYLPDARVAAALQAHRVAEWVGDRGGLFHAVLAHHGRPIALEGDTRDKARKNWRRVGAYDPTAAACEIGAVLSRWFSRAFVEPDQPLPSTPAFEHLFAGLVALADWVGSSLTPDRFVSALDVDYMTVARADAAARVAAIGLDPLAQRRMLKGAPSFSAVSDRLQPNAQQDIVGATDLDAHLVVLEAETGSGKTEAALWRYAQLFAAGRVDALYFAVPTRAAAAQLHRRVDAAAKRLFGHADPQAVLAVPGYLRAGGTSGTALPNWKVRWDDDDGADERRVEARWAAEDAKKYLAAQIAVGTVDQAMLGTLLVKHAHVRAASLSRSLLVVDEVHASDRYMGVIQKRLLDHHLGVGGYAMLMSATLGSSARSNWLGHRPPTLAEAIATPYPAVWTDRATAPQSSQSPVAREKSVAMEVVPSMAPDVTAQHALELARRGARVLVIRNTVTRAIETLEALEAIAEERDRDLLFRVGGVATLHHSRFAPTDRMLLDRTVEQALATDRNRPPGGKIIIGTQTLEQSLDICADHLITDLCPVDVLLQRIGRLHRHDLPRPSGFEKPRCQVLVPEAGPGVDGHLVIEAWHTPLPGVPVIGVNGIREHPAMLPGVLLEPLTGLGAAEA